MNNIQIEIELKIIEEVIENTHNKLTNMRMKKRRTLVACTLFVKNSRVCLKIIFL